MNQVSLLETAGRWELQLRGPLDPASAESVRGAALRATASGLDVAIDWSEAEYLSAAVLQVLLALKENLRTAGRRLVITRDSAGIREYVELAGLTTAFPKAQEAD